MLVGGGTPHTSGCEPHTQQQTLAAEWLNSIPGEREEGEGGTNILQKYVSKEFFLILPRVTSMMANRRRKCDSVNSNICKQARTSNKIF